MLLVSKTPVSEIRTIGDWLAYENRMWVLAHIDRGLALRHMSDDEAFGVRVLLARPPHVADPLYR
jgi:hypothetical protein